jgi:tRNA nucleotidyltransferase (CCA-adding enzyme)
MMKMKVGAASCRVVFRKHLGGSVLKGTVFNRWDSVDTFLKLNSDEPAEKLAHLIKNAKAGCFAEGLIVQPVPLHSHIEVNGQPFHIEGVTG